MGRFPKLVIISSNHGQLSSHSDSKSSTTIPTNLSPSLSLSLEGKRFSSQNPSQCFAIIVFANMVKMMKNGFNDETTLTMCR